MRRRAPPLSREPRGRGTHECLVPAVHCRGRPKRAGARSGGPHSLLPAAARPRLLCAHRLAWGASGLGAIRPSGAAVRGG